MSPKRILAAAFFAFALLAGPATRGFAGDPTVAPVPAPAAKPGTDAEPKPAKVLLYFSYPCAFAYTNGKPYAEKRVMDYECDYIHASVKGGRDTFNNLPTVEAQKAFLEDVIGNADQAHNEYIKVVAALIIQTDPAKVPKTVKGKDGKPRNITVDERMKKIGELNILLSTGVFEAAKPFLWPAREGQTYVEKTAGSWPASWHPYIQPIIDRSQQLSGLVQEDEQKIIDKASADLDKKLAAMAKKQAALSKGMNGMDRDPSALDMAFDGGGSHPGEAVQGPDAKDALAARLDAVVGKPIAPVSDLKSSPPPGIPDGQERDQRNYFARGAAAATQRLKDDASIAMLHMSGLTHTIGDPYSKAGLIFHQKGPSCAVATQYEAMRARGQQVKIEDLAVEGRDKGYFVDYAASDGSRVGGTPWGNLDSLLNDHGVKATAVDSATPKQLDAAVKRTGDAIVYVFVKGFWNDPTVGDRETHAIYITGAEVDKSGAVRGYYVNDTGTGEAARYISAPDFNKVWTKNLVTFQDASKH